METQIYVLQLVDGRYYVGKTTNIAVRYQAHLSGQGAEWTKIHEPERLLETSEQKTPFDEDNKVKELMIRCGIENVRGGTYSQVQLSRSDISILEREISTVGNTCFKCKKTGHFARDCPSSRNNSEALSKKGAMMCSRCGRNSHTIEQCYAKTMLDGTLITNAETSSTSPGGICCLQ